MKKIIFLILPFAAMLCSCFYSVTEITSEDSINQSLRTIEEYPDGYKLVNFAKTHPVRIEYADTAGICHHFNLKDPRNRTIFIPEEYRASDKILAMGVYRALQIYRMYVQSGLGEMVSEEEEISMLRQMQLGVMLGITKEEFDKVPEAVEMKDEFCTYILENSEEALAKTRLTAQTPNQACQRPLDNIVKQGFWIKDMKKSISKNEFHQLMQYRDKKRVAQGAMTDSEAAANSARLMALPEYETARYERLFFDIKKSNFDYFKQLYLKEVFLDRDFRREYAKQIYEMSTDFAECDLENLKTK